MIMNIYIIQDLDLDVKNFHNKFKFFYIIYFAYIFIIACNYGFCNYLISIEFVCQFLIDISQMN